MTRCKEMFSVLALLAPIALVAFVASPKTGISEASASRGLPSLCQSTVGVCEVQSVNDAPELAANVCWDSRSEILTLMPAAGCTGEGRGYSVTHGFVADPTSNVVFPIAAVIDTCEAGFCVPNQLDPGASLIDGVACCNPKTGECEAADSKGMCSFGDVTWCEKLEDNGDGTVTCHE
jgi:hypothetical protein